MQKQTTWLLHDLQPEIEKECLWLELVWLEQAQARLGQLLANKGYRVSNGDCGTCGFTQTGERLNSLLGIHSGRSACFNRVVVHYVLLSEKARPVAGGLLAIWCIWICKATAGHAPLNLVP